MASLHPVQEPLLKKLLQSMLISSDDVLKTEEELEAELAAQAEAEANAPPPPEMVKLQLVRRSPRIRPSGAVLRFYSCSRSLGDCAFRALYSRRRALTSGRCSYSRSRARLRALTSGRCLFLGTFTL